MAAKVETGLGDAGLGNIGLSEAGFKFLAQLKRHNDRDWFNGRKDQYKETVEQPMLALVHAVSDECRRRGLPLYAKEKSPVMRVYRDVRFSKDKKPYKTHVAAELRRSFSDSNVMLYLHFSPTESLLGAGVWQPDRPLLGAWREAIAARPERFASVVTRLKKGGLSLSVEHSLAKMPRGFQMHAAEPFAEWLKLSSFIAVRTLSTEECLRTGLVKRIGDFALTAKPLLEFSWQMEESGGSRKAEARLNSK